jgi:hypothetical protein
MPLVSLGQVFQPFFLCPFTGDEMPKVEKAIHLDAFKLYMKMGGMSPAFIGRFRTEFGKSRTTAFDWQKAFDWKARLKTPIDEAVQELEEADKLNAEELIGGLLDLCRNRMEGLAGQSEEIKAIMAISLERTKAGKPKLKATNISEVAELVRAQSRLVRDEQAYMRLLLTLVGEPEKIMEDRMIVQFVGLPEGFLDDDSSDPEIISETD